MILVPRRGAAVRLWLDETLSSEEAPPTEVVTDENGETKVVEYETDAQGKIATEANGEKITKPAPPSGNEDPAAPVNGNTTTTTTKANNQGNTTTTTTRPHTTTTTRPNTTTTTTQPAPTPPPVPAELTEADKEAMVDELIEYARKIGYDAYEETLGSYSGMAYDVTPKNYESVLNAAKSRLSSLVNTSLAPENSCIFEWSKTTNKLYIEIY